MKKTILILSILLVSICSCVNSNKGSKSQYSSTAEDTLYNDNIQGVFFDTPFGASKKEVINNFESMAFMLSHQ